MTQQTLLLLTMLIPLAAAVSGMVFRNAANLRDSITFFATVALFITVLVVLSNYTQGVIFSFEFIRFQPGISIAFHAEPLGIVFALVASSLWILTHIYGVGYMRGNKEKHHARFFACFSIALFATMGIAFSANLLTLFIFYEILTVSTYPLVAHKENADAKAGARTYLGILMGTSIVFLLTAIIWTYVITGTMNFTPGGIFSGDSSGSSLPWFILPLFVFGIGKAAIMPFHRWLPAAMVAPTPVSALLHAVAVVKAGVFSMLKVGVYVFGIDTLAVPDTTTWLMWLAGFSIIAASVVAMRQDNLKRRLAYSTVSQLSYITLGVALASSMGAVGGGLHIVTHAFGKITLFMCAGAIYVATHKTEISQMRGLGRTMPFTFVAFGIGALSIIGLPPLGGSWSKWLLLVGAADAAGAAESIGQPTVTQLSMMGVLMLSSVLNIAYLVPVFARGFYGARDDVPPEGNWRERISEAPWMCVLPPCITALGCIVLFFYAGDIAAFLEPIGATIKTEVTQ